MNIERRVGKLEQALCPKDTRRLVYIGFVSPPGQEPTPENTYLRIDGRLVRQSEVDSRNITILSEEDALL
jgi:hypothetical protein